LKKATKKQLNAVQKIRNDIGEDVVKEYFYKHFHGGDYNNLSKKQAQKLITGLQPLPDRRIYGVVGRDIRSIHLK